MYTTYNFVSDRNLKKLLRSMRLIAFCPKPLQKEKKHKTKRNNQMENN